MNAALPTSQLAAPRSAIDRLNSAGEPSLQDLAAPVLNRGRAPAHARPKGYFPVPALKHVRGPFLELMRGILQSEACIRRGLYQRAYVDKLLANPEAHFTRIQGSKLWHMALLEWWLQVHVDGVASGPYAVTGWTEGLSPNILASVAGLTAA